MRKNWRLTGIAGMLFFITACSALFVGVQVMFEVREAEARQDRLREGLHRLAVHKAEDQRLNEAGKSIK